MALNRGAVWKVLWAPCSGSFSAMQSSMLCHMNKIDKSMYVQAVMRLDVAGRGCSTSVKGGSRSQTAGKISLASNPTLPTFLCLLQKMD